MFLTLILQYLNKLIESEVGDFTTPKPFHAVKVQGFKDNGIKAFTKFRGKLPLKVFALVRDFPIQTCNLSDTPPPTVRTLLLTTQVFVEGSQLIQIRFQRLGVLFLFTRAKCQICVFHTEICPNTFTRCRQRLCFYKVGEYVKPIITAVITFNRDTTDISFKLTVLMERIRHFIISPFTILKSSKGEGDTILFQRPACLF